MSGSNQNPNDDIAKFFQGGGFAPFEDLFRELENTLMQSFPENGTVGVLPQPRNLPQQEEYSSPRDRVLRRRESNVGDGNQQFERAFQEAVPNERLGGFGLGAMLAEMMRGGLGNMMEGRQNGGMESWGHSMSSITQTTTETDENGEQVYKTTTKKCIDGVTTTTTSIRRADGTILESNEERSLPSPQHPQALLPPSHPQTFDSYTQRDLNETHGPPQGIVRVPHPNAANNATSEDGVMSSLSSWLSQFWKPKL
eukprot:m.23653 g.23653  ORF g.23653 m.23653 type:complete len:254 (+) comp7527_c0_seq2:161-922(+)